jgi:sec-independent protein translocase protein TatA
MPIGFPEMLVIAVVALLVLGPKRLPEAGRSLGSGLREFKAAIGGGRTDDRDDEAS